MIDDEKFVEESLMQAMMTKIQDVKNNNKDNFDHINGKYNHEKNKVKFIREVAMQIRVNSRYFQNSPYQNMILMSALMLLKKSKIFMDYNEYNLCNSKENTFKLDRFDDWLQSTDCKHMTKSFQEEAFINTNEWNDSKQEAYRLQWNEADSNQVIKKFDDPNQNFKFIDQVINYKIKEMKNILNDPNVFQNMNLNKNILLNIIMCTIATNVPQKIDYHSGEDFNWKSLTIRYENMDVGDLMEVLKSFDENED